jgi:class 3 adenylate cyclase/HAMP domain-containing protein
MIKTYIKQLLYKGGLKLKLVSFVFVSILLAILVQNYFVIPFIKENLEKKAFEVSSTTIERISEFSSFALLERTYENRLSLDDAIEKLKESHIDGLIGVAIYQRQKGKQGSYFEYIAGFGDNIKELPLDTKLLGYMHKCQSEDVIVDTYTIKANQKEIQTYRFIRPILYKYKGENILLGFTVLYYDKQAITIIIDKVLNYIYTTALIILLLSTLYVYFIGTRVTQPIIEITKASSAITKGDLDIHLDVRTNDEIQNLANHFNTMVAWLKEKDKLQKFVSNSTVNMIKSSADKPVILGGKYETLTFMFCDIRNFTSLNEKKTPQEVISIVNCYLSLQAQIIKENGGDIDKFIGDEVMASFSGEDATLRAIKSALEIQESIAKENKRRASLKQTYCYVGIGISRGKVVVGNIGFNEHMDYTAIGLAVNLTSRLCSKAKEEEIIIDKKTFVESGSTCRYSVSRPLTLKGISHPVEAYSLIHSEVNDAL